MRRLWFERRCKDRAKESTSASASSDVPAYGRWLARDVRAVEQSSPSFRTNSQTTARPVGDAEFLAGPAQELAGCDQLASPLGEQRPVPVTRVEIRHGTKRAAAQPSKTPGGLQARRFGMKIV